MFCSTSNSRKSEYQNFRKKCCGLVCGTMTVENPCPSTQEHGIKICLSIYMKQERIGTGD